MHDGAGTQGTADLRTNGFRPGDHEAGVTKTGMCPWMGSNNERPGTVDLEDSSGNMQHPRAREGPMLDRPGSPNTIVL